MAKLKKTDRTAEYVSLGKHPDLNTELVSSSDRGAVLIGTSIIDLHLERLLTAFLVDDKKEVNLLISSKDQNAPLGTLSARARAAYCLGLISKVEFEAISDIRSIRNAFAHDLFDCSFLTPSVRDACESLKIFNQIARPPQEFSTRTKFTFAVVTLEATLSHRLSKVTRQPHAFKFAQP